jgi:methyl-accepting chemotaxis protein
MDLPIWVRFLGSVLLFIGTMIAGLTYWSVREQKRLAIEQARTFAAGSAQVVTSGLAALMMTGNAAQVADLMEQMRKSQGIESLKIIRGELVSKQFGPGESSREPPDALEQRVVADGQSQLVLATQGDRLVYRAVIPVIAKGGGASGTGCPTCHQVDARAVMGAVSVGIGLDHLRQSANEFRRNVFLGASALGLLFLWAIYFCIAATITRPLREIVAQFKDIAEGDGDLTKRILVRNQDEVGQAAQWFNRFIAKIQDIVGQAKSASDHVASASQQLSAASQQLAAGAQEQAASLEETAASLEEITGSVKQNADNARQANQLAVGSRDTAEKGGEVVKRAVESMGEINKASRKIADIVTTIDDIAFQTNLLALNAAVEAARAGAQGKSFAVVASEVRNLAQRSATAAKEIKALIQDSVTKVDSGSELVNHSGQSLQEIVTSVKRVTDIIGEIAAASQEQSSGIDQVNKAVAQMDRVVQSNAAQTEELSSTAQSLSAHAEELQELVGRFKVADGPSQPRQLETDPSTARQPEPVLAFNYTTEIPQ